MKKLINCQVGLVGCWVFGLLFFVILVVLYLVVFDVCLDVNFNDKLLFLLSSFFDVIECMVFEFSKCSGEYIFLVDILVSLQWFGIGVVISVLIGLVVGIVIGLLLLFWVGILLLVIGMLLVLLLVILLILFIIFGFGELVKVMLIIIGIIFFLICDLQQWVEEIFIEQIIKMQILGVNIWQIIICLVWLQIMLCLFSFVCLLLGFVWLFLIVVEVIVVIEGLGYCIFLVCCYLVMDVILFYVVWIIFLVFVIDFVFKCYF